MLRMCMPLASLHGEKVANNINSYSWKQQTPSGVHADGLQHHSVQTGVTADAYGCRPQMNSSAAGAMQQLQPWCQEQHLSHLSLSIGLQQQPEQQQQQHQQQQQKAFQLLSQQHTQASLMQGLVVLQQPSLQRAFSTSTSAHNRHSGKPQLHQPMKHVSGTDPLKTLRVTNSSSTLDSWAGSSSAEQQAAEAAAAAAEPGSSSRVSIKEVMKQRWQAGCGMVQQKWQAGCEAAGRLQDRVMALPWRTISTVGMKAGVCVTCAVAVYIIVQDVTLTGSSGILATANADPSVQCLAVSRLHQLLWRPAWWPAQWALDAAQQMVDRGLLSQLAGLVKPGTDAVVLNEVFLLLQRLLESDDTMARAMQKAGVAEALGKGLQEGWLPRGALETAAALQDKLQSPAKQQQQQQQGKRRLPPIGAAARTVTAAGAATQR